MFSIVRHLRIFFATVRIVLSTKDHKKLMNSYLFYSPGIADYDSWGGVWLHLWSDGARYHNNSWLIPIILVILDRILNQIWVIIIIIIFFYYHKELCHKTNKTRQILYYVATKNTCLDCESNTGPSDLQSDALPTELSRHLVTSMNAFGYTNSGQIEEFRTTKMWGRQTHRTIDWRFYFSVVRSSASLELGQSTVSTEFVQKIIIIIRNSLTHCQSQY
jgi:hypothetical protein